ncbi:hypothetical protein Taro_054835 [Colocasia esculenta]|uniref:Uncharacterized protein n=1 Tax=Colocasia esculenta TaxID=4460 RepID=A0A843XRU4_COLES|nr:hypothetical protein [Colocasia esculenta]
MALALQVKNRGVLAFPTTGLEQVIEELENNRRIHKNEEIKKLITKMKHNIAVLKDAEKKQLSSEVHRFWLGKLREVAFDAEDLIDELATDAAVQSLGARTYSNPTATRSMMDQIRQMNDRLDYLEPQIAMLVFQLSAVQDSCLVLPTWRQTGSLLPDESSVIGRNGEKEQIIEILLSDPVAESSSNNNKGFSIVPIVGLGGMGKTTLAQLVYNDEKVKKHFELMIWVCVSNNSDRQRLTKEMIEAAFAYKGRHEKCDITNWDSVQQTLRQEVTGKTFLLVLDEVWGAEYSMWEELFKPLHSGKKGSKVLVTARNRAFVNKLGGRMETPIPLGGLSDADIWDVFNKYAFRGNVDADGTTSAEYSHLEDLGSSIVQRLKGSPIRELHRSIGHLKHLRYIDLERNYGLRGLPESLGDLHNLQVLNLSYCQIEELPSSIGHLKHLRDIDLERNYGLRGLPESLGDLHNLQVLNLDRCRSLRVLPSTMSQLVKLKDLQTYYCDLLSRIDGVGKLTDLQELQARGRQLRELGGMCMLQELKITNLEEVGSKEEAIQARLHTMKHLQVLQLYWSSEDNSSIEWEDSRKLELELEEEVLQALRPNKGIRKLCIGGYGGIKSPNWMEVSTLASFSSLRHVVLKDCPNWQVPPCSFLGQLHHLEYLEINRMPEWEEWSCPVSWDCLQQLTIRGCPRLKELPLLPPTLRSLYLFEVGISCLPELDGCSRVEGGIETTSSPHSPSTSASLYKLHIFFCDNLISIGGLLLQQLPDLVEIEICNCKNLVSLPEKGFGHLISLKRLKIIQCPKLTCLLQGEEDAQSQHLPRSLGQLEISLCGDAMGGWWWTGLQRLTSIAKLSLPGGVQLQQSFCLTDGKGTITLMQSCASSTQRTKWGGCGLPSSLERLIIVGDDNLDHKCLSDCLHDLISLQKLTLDHFENLQLLPNLSGLTSLETLFISYSRSIQSWPTSGLPSSLQTLQITRCPALTRGHEDKPKSMWPDVAHIAHVDIDGFLLITMCSRTMKPDQREGNLL